MADKYLTLTEIAAELRISPETARRAALSGVFKAVQVGGLGSAWRVEAKSFREFKSRQDTSSCDPRPGINTDVTEDVMV